MHTKKEVNIFECRYPNHLLQFYPKIRTPNRVVKVKSKTLQDAHVLDPLGLVKWNRCIMWFI